MYENITFSKLLERTLEKVSEKYDKRQGSIIYDAIAPICAELSQFYLELDRVLDEGFADTSTRKYLIKRAKERGLHPYPQTHSLILAKLEGNINLNGGERFNLEDLNFIYTGEKEGDYFKLKCEKAGSIGNIDYGELLPIQNIDGLERAYVIKVFSYGKDEEDTEHFRKRYFDSFNNIAFGGNKADYISKIISLNEKNTILENGGIGGCKVYRTPKGEGTVHIIITDSTYSTPTPNLIQLIQNYINPTEYDGDGEGIAPIGHFVTIYPVLEEKINISFELDLKPTSTILSIKPEIDKKINNYIKSVAKNWQDEKGLILRISHIESEILKIPEIIDIRNTSINNQKSNLFIEEKFIPTMGEINVN